MDDKFYTSKEVFEMIKESLHDGMETGFVFGYLCAIWGQDWPDLLRDLKELRNGSIAEALNNLKEFKKYELMASAHLLTFHLDVLKDIEKREEETKES